MDQAHEPRQSIGIVRLEHKAVFPAPDEAVAGPAGVGEQDRQSHSQGFDDDQTKLFLCAWKYQGKTLCQNPGYLVSLNEAHESNVFIDIERPSKFLEVSVQRT